MGDDSAISFTISHEGADSKEKPPKTFTLRPGSSNVVRIGRAPGNDVVITHRGASQYHAELRYLPDSDGDHRLHVRDLSMNGTGLKANEKTATQLRKSADEVVPDGAVILVPMQLKMGTDRAWLKVSFTELADIPKRPRDEGREDPPSPAKEPAARARSGSEQDEEKDAEQSRMAFVELLLKTREVSAGTTYEEARRLLSGSSVWSAVDESTRRECFEIFVEHLGSNNKGSKKKDKSGKGKKEKRRHQDDEADGQKDGEGGRGKRRKEDKKGGSGSPERHRKSKRDKKGRDRSRGRSENGNGSRSHSRQKKRRRARSGSA